ncbi:ankyrin repeat and fibronectin type-III domain-containing protein 1 isoform X2 [Danaus plexippus]|uniref:ankyrin repeat and fibronectin type-III domain-containing protein 1 isoform X2 n=1 Tax=Danaus plexippus TaxID=13037 RepID=UPI002AB0F2C8|nr:ankyrin repeat and fibronectin type-III domain-containing protein 1 isoform X2 [Danaus plexippus]XP_061377408.1 ankyrin repeat and fibronectin type-III domain-containing protein 1 isoform X2 [Danaus plexippus]
METLLDKFKRDQGGLRRSRSVRASLRLIGNRWRSTKDEETSENIDTIKDGNVVLTQIFNGDKDYNVAYTGIDGTYKAKTPNMAKRKQEPVKPRKKSGDIDLTLKPQRHRKVDKAKISDLFNKKQKSVSAKELLVPEKIPPKAAAILHINSPDTKLKIKLKSVGKSESAKSVTDIKHRRTRRGSESDMCGSQPRGFVNQAFVYSTPPKERKLNLSPSSYLKLQYGALLEGCGGELPSLSACAPLPSHPDKRKQRDARAHNDRITQVNIHLHALFAAVEHGYLDKARNILESTDVDVNSLNPDGLSPLDVAVLANNRHLVRMLMEFGAKEGSQFKSPEALGNHLRRLSREAEARLHEVTGYIPEACREEMCRSSGGNQAGTMGCAGGTGSEKDKQTQHWERRLRTLKRLVQGWQQARVPPALPSPSLEVCGPHSVTVWLATRTQARDPPLVTKYKVEWSSRADFSNVCGSREVVASCARVSVTGLTRGRRYFFRAAAGNVKGWGTYSVSVPRSVVPSSWSDISVRSSRGEAGGAAAALEALAAATASTRTRTVTRLPRKKTATIRQLFTAASKFQKNLRRGVYLTCIIYHEDRVLVTGEEFLPVVEVDETYPACIYTDFHWLMKVSCSWEEVKSLRSDMEKHTSSSIHFRLKLLTAVAQMQSALGIQDLGQLYHKPLRDSHGTVVLSCITSVKSPKAVSALNSRWLPVNKLRRRVLSDDNTMGELLMASVHEQIAYHQVSRDLLPRGLYLGYLKLQSSVEVVRIVAPSRTPNVPPHTRVRDNPHVSAEEWEYLKSQSGRSSDESPSINNFVSISSNERPSESQEMFLEQIATASKRLFKDMEIPDDSIAAHRIYDLEVIELNSDVSFIMICPPAEQACSVPGQKEILLQKGDLLSLPIQAFEMIHLQTYHTNILNKYSKLSCVLELDVALAAHSQREAFSCMELQTAKERLTKLEDLQNNLNLVWKAERWLMDLIGFARDKDKAGPSSGILLKYILDKTPSRNDEVDSNERDANLKIDLLQLPPRDAKINKTSPGRGSWPGPAGNGNHTSLHPEFSKSEQQLSIAPRQTSVSTLNLSGSQYLHEAKYARKGSADSQITESSAMSAISNNYMGSNSQFDIKSNGSHASISSNRLPPSRSEDTLVLQNENIEPKPRPHSINTSVSTSSSPLLTVKGFYPGSMISVKTNKTNVSESAQSLSSDSESQSCPLTTTVPLKIRPQLTHANVTASKSMTNVKSTDVEFTDTGQGSKGHSVKRQPLLETQEEEYNNKVQKTDQRHGDDDRKLPPEQRIDQAGILQVFAAYETGLAVGTSLKLHVTPRTSAREVIDLVVKQLNMAAVLKGKSGPVYGPEKLQDFCLVAVIGARERCLRDDFRPLQLQNPWRKGRLYVRLKHDVLAALQHSAKQPAYI